MLMKHNKEELKKIFSDHDGYIGFIAFFIICYLLGLLSNGMPWRFWHSCFPNKCDSVLHK